MSSPSAEVLEMSSRSKRTSTPRLFSSRTVSKRSTVLRANREIDLVKIRSIPPARALVSMAWNSVRLAVWVPEMPQSANTPANTHPGVEAIILL